MAGYLVRAVREDLPVDRIDVNQHDGCAKLGAKV